jgi:hypothetical protein
MSSTPDPPGHLVDEPDPVLVLFAKAEDAAGAHRNTRGADSLDGAESLVVAPRGDDLGRELRADTDTLTSG